MPNEVTNHFQSEGLAFYLADEIQYGHGMPLPLVSLGILYKRVRPALPSIAQTPHQEVKDPMLTASGCFADFFQDLLEKGQFGTVKSHTSKHLGIQNDNAQDLARHLRFLT
jgi:hypothetical protein